MQLKTDLIKLLLLIVFLSFIIPFCGAQNPKCYEAYQICNLQNHYFEKITGIGNYPKAQESLTKKIELPETNSIWLKWEIKTQGLLDFVIIPNDENNDFDFILYKSLDDGCNSIESQRIMLSGRNFKGVDTPCLGKTGLSPYSSSITELPGCNCNSGSFVKSIFVQQDEIYYLWINNNDSQKGFNLLFDGDAVFMENSNCDQINENFEIKLFPNPVHDFLIVELILNNGFTLVNRDKLCFEIFNQNGKILDKGKLNPYDAFNSFEIKTEDLLPNNYYIKIHHGGVSQLSRFIKM